MSKQLVEEYGWVAVPRDRSNIPTSETAKTSPVTITFDEIWPNTELVRKAHEHVKAQLPAETYNHSRRVYCYGYAIVTQHFPEWIQVAKDQFFETWALICLYHDLATTPDNRNITHLSFEFQGGFLALTDLAKFGAPTPQAESVAEAIIRHQDPAPMHAGYTIPAGAKIDAGQISRLGQLVQISTEFDNMGFQSWLVDKSVIEQVVEQLPRLKWSSCFSATILAEVEAKPWCHTTVLPTFAEDVKNCQLMLPYE